MACEKPKQRRLRLEERRSRPPSPSSLLPPPSSILLASRNPGKVAEITQLLDGLGIEILDLRSLPTLPAVEETGATFVENALLKARFYYQRSGMPTLADDSGLEVDALGGAPGIHAARYAGPDAADADRIEKLLRALEEVPPDQRTARFVCALALVGPNEFEKTFTGICEGRIAEKPVGEGGFGYDPIFEYPPLGKTFAQLSRQEKSSVSHRGRALQQLRQCVLQWKADI